MISKINESMRDSLIRYCQENQLFIMNNSQTHLSFCFNCEKEVNKLVGFIENTFSVNLRNIEVKAIANSYYKEFISNHMSQRYKIKLETKENFINRTYSFYISCVISS